ncbi:MAG: hypothetical protein E7399_07410 [Ruminococcaceae bacterium]|nr:hypothetical protein [Oscillospiraceae bacterium]
MNQLKTVFTRNRLFWMLCAFLSILPSAVLSGWYAPVLDDYIMYQGYYLYDISYLLGTVRVWTTRPVANLLDIFVWARFYENLFLLFLIFQIIRIVAVYLLSRFFDEQGWEGVKMPLCLLLFLYPMGVEATGWLSAASRIVVGLFFLSVSFYFLTKNRYGWFSVFLLLSFGCYEQFIFLGFCLAIYDLWFRNKKMLWIPFAAGITIAVYYLICNQWNNTPRMNFAIDWTAFAQSFTGWKIGLLTLLPASFGRGIALLKESRWLAILTIFVIVCLMVVWKPEKNSKKLNRVWGVVVFAACHVPFFILDGSDLSFRVLYLSLIGIALLFSGGKGIWRKGIYALLLFVFCVGTMGSLKDYQMVGQKDLELLHQVAETVENNQVTAKQQYYLCEPSAYYGQHMISVFHSDWSFAGGMCSVTGNINLETVLLVDE